MARIVYKEGLEGQNRLECIEGIEIDLLNGQKALIYPKYAEKALLPQTKVDDWRELIKTEIDALKQKYSGRDTAQLLKLGSPAAEWVNQFYSDAYATNFNLPTLLAAMEVQRQGEEIDALAETIEGVDLLKDYTKHIWSCFRQKADLCWIANGYRGFLCGNYVNDKNLSVPVILYR